jgi:hypothetical protein
VLLTEKYANQIDGTITCYDRIIIQGVIPVWSYAEGMTGYFYGNEIKIFDYAKFSQPLTESVRKTAEQIAKDEGIEIEFIRKTQAFRKDDRIQEIIKEKEVTEGLVHIFSAMEKCNTYRPWHDKESGRTFFKYDTSKCLHYYFYFIDRELGLCYMRVPTWCPFRLQFYMNGHNLLASKLRKKNIEYEMLDNAFIHVSDCEMAQKLSDRFNPDELHKILDVFAARYCPVAAQFGMSYAWTIMQIECATDIVFKKQEYLQPMYDEIIRTAIHTVRPDNIATFLGQRITYNCKKEVGNNFNQRILGTRIKHHMGDVSIKMYDKFGLVLRIESTCNNVGAFRVTRDVQHKDGSVSAEKAPMRKSIYSLYQLFTIMKAANYRYLEFISTFDDHSDGDKNLSEIAKPVIENGRSYRGFNFFSQEDLNVLVAIDRGEFNINGLQNRDVRRFLVNVSSAAMSRIFKRLSLHGLIDKIAGTHRHILTSLGKSVVAAGLKVKNMIVVPQLSLM